MARTGSPPASPAISHDQFSARRSRSLREFDAYFKEAEEFVSRMRKMLIK
ncbi:MAG TPA: hypothetical protein VJC16_07380 [Candidatus Nanoarchaeia archaeon]|nr:hypothetical protein [Candidatus Nanoarchaeia archaeon]